MDLFDTEVSRRNAAAEEAVIQDIATNPMYLPAIVKRMEYDKALSNRGKWLNELELEYDVKVPPVEK